MTTFDQSEPPVLGVHKGFEDALEHPAGPDRRPDGRLLVFSQPRFDPDLTERMRRQFEADRA